MGASPSSSLNQQENTAEPLADRILTTIYGQCVGDTIGLLTEFMIKREAKKYYGRKPRNLEYSQKVPDLHRSRWAEGDWTDDSDQMFLILQSVLYNRGEVIATDFATRLKRWMKKGFPDLGDYAGMGIGKTTKTVLMHPNFTTDPHKVANECWENSQRNIAPNGGIMRTSILGIHQWESLDAVVRNTLEICKTTHYDPRCQASAVAVAVCIALMFQHFALHGDGKSVSIKVDDLIKQSYDSACKLLETDDQKQELWFYMSCTKLKKLQLAEPNKIGYTYKCLGAGFWALKQDNFQKAMIKVVMEAGDADTNGAVAGALLACKLGQSSIPQSWITGLKHREWLVNLYKRFLLLQSEMKLPLEERTPNEDLDIKKMDAAVEEKKQQSLLDQN